MMISLFLFGIMIAILAHPRPISALPLADPILPKITIRHDFSAQALSETDAAVKIHLVRTPTTSSNPIMPLPTQYIQPRPLDKRGKGRRLMARFYPLDTDNSTSANSPQMIPVPSLSPTSDPLDGLNFSSPSSQRPSANDSSAMQPFTATGTVTALSSATSTPDVVTDRSPLILPTGSTLRAVWIRTLPPTTALSTLVPSVPEPQPNLVSQSWSPGTSSMPTTSQNTAETSAPIQSGNASCPFQSGIHPPPDADTTPDPSFPVIVTILPMATSSSAVV